MRHWITNQRGNTLIMAALMTAVLAGFGILTIDIGRMLVTRTQLQNAADAGALAGASLFCEQGTPTDGDIQGEVRLVGGANKALEDNAVLVDIPNANIAITRAPDGGEVQVTTRSNTRQFITGLFTVWGRQRVDRAAVGAVATAKCGATCGVNCVKPWSIPDRWDDVTAIAGYTGGGGRGGNATPNWQGNDRWDAEEFVDQNDNRLYDVGESYTDGNGNGRFDQEAYHPLLTGYIPDPYPGNTLTSTGDLGLNLVLHADNPSDGTPPAPGQYWSVDLPPINKGTPVPGGDEYRENIARCNTSVVEPGDWLLVEPGLMTGPTNQGMRDLIAQDPDAYWDDATGTVQGSRFSLSPRIVLIPLHDPRIPIDSGRMTLQVTKVAAFFMERMVGPAEVRGRFIKVRGPGTPCPAGQAAGSFVYNLSLIR